MPSSWVLELPIQILINLTDVDALAKPVVLIFSTEDNEFHVEGFDTKEEAKEHMEKNHAESEGYFLDYAFVEGKLAEWKERRHFDFVEKKCSGPPSST